MKKMMFTGAALGALALCQPALAHGETIEGPAADDHAPIGVMGDHAHKKGEWMVSLRQMHMEMEGNQIGSDSVSPEQIVTTVPNRFAGVAGQPPTLRIVPESMRADMTMLGVMYAPSDAVTLMVMGSYIEKEMDLLTFAGPAGTVRRGTFTTNPKGLGDVKLSALFPLLGHPAAGSTNRDELTLKVGVSIPTGSITKAVEVLTPMGMTPTMRAPYAMQIGSGSWDFEPALTYKLRRGRFGAGLQGSASLRTARNDKGYRLGDMVQATGWVSYRPAQWISLSGRAQYRDTDGIEGIDPAIIGPVQTANPEFSGGERVDLLAGVNLVGTSGSLKGHRLGVEFGKPVWQDLHGPQMAGDWTLTAGWQYAF